MSLPASARVGLPLVLAGAGALAGAVFASLVRLPSLFPGSDIVLVGGLTAALTLGLAMLLPDRLLYTLSERLRYGFEQRHDVSPDRAAAALATVQKALGQAATLRAADQGFAPDLAARVADTAARLEQIATAVYAEPAQVRRHQVVVTRADLIVEAVARHAALRGQGQADAAQVATARQIVNDALDGFAAVLDARDDTAVAEQIEGIETTAQVAQGLLDRIASGKGSNT